MDIENLKKIRNQLDELIKTEEPKSNFTITISDEYSEYKYPLYIGDHYSIDEVYTGICKHFNVSKGLSEGIYEE